MIRGRQCIGTIGIMGGIETVPTSFCRSLERLRTYTERHVTLSNEEVLTTWASNSYHVSARNELASKRMGEFTLMLDTDQVFRPSTLGDLWRTMREHNMLVLTGVYYQKQAPFMPLLYRMREDEDQTFQMLTDFPRDMPFRVAAAGAGCLLIRNEVLARIERELGEGPFDIRHPFSEDLSFFRRLMDLEIEVWCDPRVATRHLRTVEVTDEDHRDATGGMQVKRYPAVALEV